MKKYAHIYIVRVLDCFIHDKFLCIVMDYAEQGSLYSEINRRRKESKPFTETEVLTYFTQISLALRCLYANNIVNFDIKTQKIIMKQEGDKSICLLADFGISRIISTLTDLTNTAQNAMTPNIINGRPHNQAADRFSLGCVLYEMCALQCPFNCDSREQIECVVLNSDPTRIPDMYSNDL